MMPDEIQREAASAGRPGFGDALGLTVKGVAGNLKACLALAAVPALVAGPATALMDVVTAGLPDDPSGLGFGELASSMSLLVAGAGTLFIALLVLYPLALAGLARIGAKAWRSEPVTPGEAWEAVARSGPAAVGATLLGMLAAFAVPAALWVASVFVPPLMVVALASMVWPAFVYVVRFLLAVPVVVEEGLGPVDALGRSVELVRGGFWLVLGVWLVSAFAGSLLSAVVGLPFAFADPGTASGFALAAVAGALGQLVSLPLTGVALGVLYAVRTTS